MGQATRVFQGKTLTIGGACAVQTPVIVTCRRRKRVLFVYTAWLFLWGTAGALGADWQAGVAKVDITPKRSVWLGGYAARKGPAVGTLHPLWAKALAIEDGQGKRVVIVTMDLLGDNFGRELADQIRTVASQRTGTPPDCVMFNFSHTPAVRFPVSTTAIWSPMGWTTRSRPESMTTRGP